MSNLKATLAKLLESAIRQHIGASEAVVARQAAINASFSDADYAVNAQALAWVNRAVDLTVSSANDMERHAIALIRECEKDGSDCAKLHELAQALAINRNPGLLFREEWMRQFKSEIEAMTRSADDPESLRSPAEQSYSPAELCELFGMSNGTLHKHAKNAGVKTPTKGQRDFSYALSDALTIARQILAHSPTPAHKRAAADFLANTQAHKQIPKSKSNPNRQKKS